MVNQRGWGFYGRSEEQARIIRILERKNWFFCAISGRRRIGKTTLIQRALLRRNIPKVFYFQVPDSDERGVVQTFQDALEDTGTPQEVLSLLGNDFLRMARTIEFMCKNGWIVVIDEFQYFHRKALNPFISHLQAVVDRLRDTNDGGLFVLGSIHTEMTAILDDQSSPLFNRVTDRIEVRHWDFETLFEMFDAHGVIDPYERLFLWSLFEGVPKFYRDCHDQEVLAPIESHRTETLRRLFFDGPSPLRDEATNWFLRELRGRYDSVLKLLARKGPCAHSVLVGEYAKAGSNGERQLSQYLSILIERYQMVERQLPILAPDKARKARYALTDNFLSSWLYGLERNVQVARIRPIDEAVARASDALVRHEGYTFEKLVKLATEECSRKGVGDISLTELVRGFWNRPANADIELDLVAIDEEHQVIRFGSCKRNPERHKSSDLEQFESFIVRFLKTSTGRRFAHWDKQKCLYSPVFPNSIGKHLRSKGYRCIDLNDVASALGRPPQLKLLAPEG